MGRGDLHYAIPLSSTGRSRQLGIQRGLVHSSQCTEDQTGQLYYRKRALHGSSSGRHASAMHLRATVAAWSYLIPSLQQCLAGREAPSPRHAKEHRRWFLHEVCQRLPLLEDSFADAELKLLVQWPVLFQKAGVVLPVNPSRDLTIRLPTVATPTPSLVVQESTNLVVKLEEVGLRGELPDRIVLLTQHVVTAVEADLAVLCGKGPATGSKAARLQESMMRQRWDSSVCWHAEQSAEPAP